MRGMTGEPGRTVMVSVVVPAYNAVYASGRRGREGWHRVLARSTVNAMSRFLLRRPPPLPMTDVR